MVVAVDINSYLQPTIDHLGGPTHIRQNCLAATLLSFGLKDTFKESHPATQAFTHISETGGSRFDQIWTRPAAGTQLDTANAPMIWDWPHQTHHTPVIGDLLPTVPTIQDKWCQPSLPAWRKLLRDAADPIAKPAIQERIAKHIDQHKASIESVREELANVRFAKN